jgi:hypothetical protein
MNPGQQNSKEGNTLPFCAKHLNWTFAVSYKANANPICSLGETHDIIIDLSTDAL